MKDPYRRPDRDEIAARVLAQQPPGSRSEDDDLDDVVTRREPQRGPLANFATHLAAQMRALGWDQAELQKRSGLSLHILGRAMNGTAVELGTAEKLAGLVGCHLATMIGPYHCSTCHGEPPAGFSCLECGTETRAA